MPQHPHWPGEDGPRRCARMPIAAILLAIAGMTAGAGSAVAGPVSEQCRSGDGTCHFAAASTPSRLSRNEADEWSSARRRPAQRLRVEVRRTFFTDEPGAIYGYAPGVYTVGAYGILYGPYPLNPRAPVDRLRY
jgi:hypothetical protein